MQLFNGKVEKYLPYGLGLIFFILYLLTLCPTLSFIDSGELATVCCTLGIAHPTGYPLFTLVGHLFSKFPLFNSEIYTLNVMCAIFCAVGLIFFFKFNYFLFSSGIENGKPSKNKKKTIRKDENKKNIVIIASVVSVLSLGLSRNYWMQSTSIEVYPLHVLFISLLLWIFIKFIENPLVKNDGLNKDAVKKWMIFGLLLGLSFTNHMTTIFLLPAFAFMYFYEYKFKTNSFKVLAYALIPFLLGLSLYLYLPLRAGSLPLLNWGNPVNLERIIMHVSAEQYSNMVFSSLAETKDQIKYFFNIIPADYIYLPIIVSLFGLVYLFNFSRKYFYFTILLFLTCFALAVNYSIVDIDSYFLLAYFMVSVWIGCGVLWIYLLFTENGKTIKTAFLLLFLLIPSIEIFNYSKTDESGDYLVEDYTMNVFKSVAPGGMVFSYQWDNWVSAAYYYQLVKGIRTDIIVIDKELCRRSWYIKQLEQRHPWLIAKSRKAVDEFLNELYKFEYHLPYEGPKIEEKYNAMFNSFIKENFDRIPIYVTNEIGREIGSEYKRIPVGLVYKLTNNSDYYPVHPIDWTFRPLKRKGKYQDMLMSFYGVMLTLRAGYENYYGYKDRAYQCYDKLMQIYPDYSSVPVLRKELESGKAGL